MQSGLILSVFALVSSAAAANLRQEAVQAPVPVTDLMTTQPQAALEQTSVPSMQVVTDAIERMQSPQTQPGNQQVATAQGGNDGTLPIAKTEAPVSQVASQFLQAFQSQHGSSQAQMSSQPEARNVTKVAFGQITDLASEFHQLREDDKAHVKQLGVDVHLREHLEQELHDAEERLEHDNVELAQETTGIVAATPVAEGTLPQNSTGDSPPALVQATSTKYKAETDKVAVATARDVKMLNADMNALRLRDVTEVKALRGNAETRSALSTQIAKEREELLAASGDLVNNLGQIRDLVAPTNAAPVDASSDAAASSPQAGDAAAVAAAQDTTPSASTAAAGAASPATEATGSGTWLR